MREVWARIWNIRFEIRQNTFISRLLYFILITVHCYYFHIWPKMTLRLPVYPWVYFSLLCVYNVFLRCFIDLFMVVNNKLLMFPTSLLYLIIFCDITLSHFSLFDVSTCNFLRAQFSKWPLYFTYQNMVKPTILQFSLFILVYLVLYLHS